MRTALLSLAVLAGCSSSNFDVAGVSDTGAPDTGAVEEAGSVDAPPIDAPPIDAPATDAAPVLDAAPCSALAANPETLYVDKRNVRASTGTSECPFATIRDAVVFVAALPIGSGKHTIRVAGGTAGAPLVYDEPMLVLKPNTALVGDGPARVHITGGGTCGDGVCMVVMEGNTTLEGVTIDAKGAAKVPLAMTPTGFTNTSAKSIVVTGAKDEKTPAVYIDGAGGAELGPDVRVIDNGGHGILVKSIFNLKLTGTPATPNQISRNRFGIQLFAGHLDVGGITEVQKNLSHGVILVMPDKWTHVLDGLQALDNGGAGVFVDGGAGVRIRHSKLLRNEVGLFFRVVGANELDLGTMLSPGDNFIGGKTERNRRAGICVPASRATITPARGNFFSMCPPAVSSMPEGEKACDTLSEYRDIYYGAPITGTTTPPPFDLDGCGSK